MKDYVESRLKNKGEPTSLEQIPFIFIFPAPSRLPT